MQGTVAHFDAATRSGTVVLDDGIELPFDRDAFDAGGLRLVRFGQRVRLDIDPAGGFRGNADVTPRITAMWLVTMRPLA